MEKLPVWIENFQWIRILLLFQGIVVVWFFCWTLILCTLKQDNSDNKTIFHSWSFGKINYTLFSIGLCIIILGYVVMATGETESLQSVKIAPLILIVGYCIIIPTAILLNQKIKHSSFNLFGVVVQLVRAPACHAGSCEFESRPPRTLKPLLIQGLFYLFKEI